MRLLVNGGTATVRRLAGRYPDLLGHLQTPACGNSMTTMLSTGLPWAADNGCFGGLDAAAFRAMLARAAGRPRCLFVAVPDVVADARATSARFALWRDDVAAAGQPLAFVGQDGVESLAPPWGEFSCWFVGGSDAWKMSPASCRMMAEAKGRGKHVHVGRVNSVRRLKWAARCGADSVDGSSMSKFGEAKLAMFLRHLRPYLAEPVLFREDV